MPTADRASPAETVVDGSLLLPAPDKRTLVHGRSESLSRLGRLIALAAIPEQYENRKHWGMTAERWDGLIIRREGLRIETKRRMKEVNHGTWKMYRVRLLDPEDEFLLQVDNLRQTPDKQAACDITVIARLAVFGRISQWEKGIQLYSLSADAQARVRLQMACTFQLSLDPTRHPPDVVVEPAVTKAEVELIDFRLQRLSDLHGPLVKQLGRGMRKIVEDRLQDQQPSIPEKINRQIAKNQDHLKLSLQQLVQEQWSKWREENGAGDASMNGQRRPEESGAKSDSGQADPAF
jgi:hypothetical protein